MRMRSIKRRRHGVEVPTHSLNDIMFFLLLFFLIIATMTNANVIKMLTSKASKEAVKNYDNKSQKYVVHVTFEKELFYNDTKITGEELEKNLIADLAGNKDMLVSVQVDAESDIQQVVDVLSICTKAGVKYYLKEPLVK